MRGVRGVRYACADARMSTRVICARVEPFRLLRAIERVSCYSWRRHDDV